MKLLNTRVGFAFALTFSVWVVPALFAQTVEKVADLNTFLAQGGIITGGANPQCRMTQVGSNLFFTTTKGGVNGVGTVSKFSLVEHQVTQVAALEQNAYGNGPKSPLLVLDQTNGYFTTLSGGSSSNKGAIIKIDLTSGAMTQLFAFQNTNGAGPRAGLTLIGSDLWTTTSAGGVSNRGNIIKLSLTNFNTTYFTNFDITSLTNESNEEIFVTNAIVTSSSNNVVAVVTNLDGAKMGGQAYADIRQMGDAWYFNTFTGGTNFGSSGLTLGGGTLSRLVFGNDGQPIFTQLVNMPAGYTQFGCSTPVKVGTNSIYFATVGTAALPGSIIRYDISSSTWTNLFSFTNSALNGIRPGYNGMTEWLGDLYFLTAGGGSSNAGVVAKFSTVSNTYTKLADLAPTNSALQLGNDLGSFSNDGLIVLETNRYFMYFTTGTGGAFNFGTILRVYLPPPPIQATLAPVDPQNVTLSWTGGYPPFDVVTNNDLTVPFANWPTAMTNINADVNTTNWSVTLPAPEGNTFYRVRGQAQ